jgi:CPA2 family monovalent cation:H+ antiporter-2
MGQVSDRVFTLTIMLAISTIVLSSYILKYDSVIYSRFSNALPFLERKADKEETVERERKSRVIVCGYNRIGFNIVNSLQAMAKDFLVVDYNPETIKKLEANGVPCMYGDVGDVDVVEGLDFSNANMVISTVPDSTDTHLLIQKVREQNKQAALIVTASQLSEAMTFYTAGADYVILPYFLGGEHVSRLIERFNEDSINIVNERLKHIEELQLREELGHEHPSHE